MLARYVSSLTRCSNSCTRVYASTNCLLRTSSASCLTRLAGGIANTCFRFVLGHSYRILFATCSSGSPLRFRVNVRCRFVKKVSCSSLRFIFSHSTLVNTP